MSDARQIAEYIVGGGTQLQPWRNACELARALLVALDRADKTEARVKEIIEAARLVEIRLAERADKLEAALRRVDEVLTTVSGDNVPRGMGPPTLARSVARDALEEASP